MLVERLRNIVQGRGPPEQDPLHPGDGRRLPASARHLPVPGIDVGAVKQLQAIRPSTGGVLGFLHAVLRRGAQPASRSSPSGSCRTSRRRSSCRSSAVVIPKLEEWQQQGAVGQRKITQWTRYLTIGIALAAVDGAGVPVPQRRRRLSSAAAATPPASTWCRSFGARPRAADRAHPHRRHRAADVDGRADQPARHRQRHVAC